MGAVWCMPWNKNKDDVLDTTIPAGARPIRQAGSPSKPGKKGKKYLQLNDSQYSPPAPAKSFTYFGTICFGLEDPAAEEIQEKICPTLIRILHGKVIFTTDKPLEEILRLRCIQNLYAYIVEVDWAVEGQKALECLGGMPLHGEAKWDDALELFAKRHPAVPLSEFRVVCSRNCFCKTKCQGFMAAEVENAIQLGIQYKHPIWRARGKGCPLQVFAHVVDRRAVLGINLTPETLDKRYKGVQGGSKTVMRASLAAALTRLAGIKPGDFVVDPMCAAGILISEAALGSHDASFCGGDASTKTVTAAKENALQAGASGVDFVRFDGVYFPWRAGKVDVIMSDMPCGVRTDSYRIDNTLYKKLLKEMSRILKVGGKIVIVSFERRLLDTQLKKSPNLKVAKEVKLNIGQFPNAVLYILVKE